MAAWYGAVNDWIPLVPRGAYECSSCLGIMNHINMFRQSLAYEVDDGRRIKFWEDAWCGEKLMKDFLEVFAMASDSTQLWLRVMLSHGGETV